MERIAWNKFCIIILNPPSLFGNNEQMDRFDTMRVFIRVMERRSFTLAAEDLSMPRSTVTDAIKSLESRLGVRLLQRTTRSVHPTIEGEAYYSRCLNIIADVEESEDVFIGTHPKGPLRVDVQGTLARHFLLPRLPEFLNRYPEIEIFMSESDRLVSLVREGIDCALRVGIPQDSDMIIRHLADLDEVTLASPGYLSQFGTPHCIEDLVNHRMVGFHSTAINKIMPLLFQSGKERVNITLPTTMSVNAVESYIAAARLGLGIVQVPRYHIETDLTDGSLISLLPDNPPGKNSVSVLYPRNRQLSLRVRVFVDWLVMIFGQQRAQDIDSAAAKKNADYGE